MKKKPSLNNQIKSKIQFLIKQPFSFEIKSIFFFFLQIYILKLKKKKALKINHPPFLIV